MVRTTHKRLFCFFSPSQNREVYGARATARTHRRERERGACAQVITGGKSLSHLRTAFDKMYPVLCELQRLNGETDVRLSL